MKIRVFLVLMASLLLCGCPPKGVMLKQRDLQHIDAGLGVDGTKIIIASDQEVDLLSKEVTELLQQQGFELLNSSVSWGLQPLTGHTQNLSFKYPGTNALHCYVQVSKKEFQVKFKELESAPQTDRFSTSKEDVIAMEQAVEALSEFAKRKITGRLVRISTFNRSEYPEKENR